MYIKYLHEIHDVLRGFLSPEVFDVWYQLADMSMGVFGRLASSSTKYHKRADGSNPTIEEHTLPMVKAAVKIIGMLNENQRMNEAIILAIAVHDIKKYGEDSNLAHTVANHGTIAAEWLRSHAELFGEVFNPEQFEVLVACVQYHSGIWSTDPLGYVYNRYFKYIQFVHMLDMLESRDCLKY